MTYFGPNDDTIVTMAGSNGYLWDARNGGLNFAAGHHQNLYDVAISGDGRLVATASQDSPCGYGTWVVTPREEREKGKGQSVVQKGRIGEVRSYHHNRSFYP